jgi:hypothetical protein
MWLMAQFGMILSNGAASGIPVPVADAQHEGVSRFGQGAAIGCWSARSIRSAPAASGRPCLANARKS